MNCEQVQNLLGRFRDGELNQAEHKAVEAHLERCARCASEVAAITELGSMVRALSEPELAAYLWDHIAQRLAVTPVSHAVSGQKLLHAWRAAVAAALLLVAVATGWLAHRPTSPSDGTAGPQATIPVVDFEPYLGPQISVPRQAQPMRPEETARQVSFRVFTTTNLPEGYALEESYLVRIEGCSVVQYKYLRGTDVALLLQYSQGQPVSFGNRPIVAIEKINGKPVQIVQGDGHLAASWSANGTAVSLVGPRNRAELARLVAYVDQQFAEDKK